LRRPVPRLCSQILTPILAFAFLCLPTLDLPLGVPNVALAAPKDAAAQKLYDQAMDEDYLNVELDKAISKLDKALKDCGSDGCAKTMVGKLYVARGVVFAGKNEIDKAKASFVEAFKADPGAKPLEDYMTPEAKEAFDAAKKEVGGTPTPGPKPAPTGDDDDTPEVGGDLDYDPPTEAQINTPLPIFVAVDDDLGAEGMTIRYKPFGATKWLRVKMKPMKGGFGAEIPCKEITTLGDLRIYIIVEDSTGDPIATAGTQKRPLVIKVKNKLDGEQPSFPGQKPPAKCMTASDCPPDFPGCEPGGDDDDGGRGDKGWGASCDNTKECRSGFVCLNGVCEEGEGDGDDGPKSSGGLRHIISIGVQADWLLIGTQKGVCGDADGPTDKVTPVPGFACFDEDDEEFGGKPYGGGSKNQVNGGLAFASVRPLAGYDLVFWEGLGAGVRIGAAIGGSPSTESGSFLPLHLEGRLFYYLPGRDGFAGGLVRPYAFAGIGFAHVDAGVTTSVCDFVEDDGTTPVSGAGDPSCRQSGVASMEERDVTAYFRTGDAFVPVGIGSTFAFTDMWGINLEIKMMIMFGNGAERDTGFAIAPSLAPVVMF
jgi:hypothetical protein